MPNKCYNCGAPQNETCGTCKYGQKHPMESCTGCKQYLSERAKDGKLIDNSTLACELWEQTTREDFNEVLK